MTAGPREPLGPTLRRAVEADVPYLVASENAPHADAFVGHWTAREHIASLTEPGHQPLVIECGGERVGAVLLGDLDEQHGNVEFKRFVVTEPGRGIGTAVLPLLIDHVFETTAAHRFWLDVIPHNARARRLYAAAGFVEEGTLREAYVTSEGRQSLVIMSILRREWHALRGHPPGNRT